MIKIRRVWDESVKSKQKNLRFQGFPVELDIYYYFSFVRNFHIKITKKYLKI